MKNINLKLGLKVNCVKDTYAERIFQYRDNFITSLNALVSIV